MEWITFAAGVLLGALVGGSCRWAAMIHAAAGSVSKLTSGERLYLCIEVAKDRPGDDDGGSDSPPVPELSEQDWRNQ